MMSVDAKDQNGVTPNDVVQAFMTAWEEGSLDRVLQTVGDDIVFVGTTGPEPGRSFEGKVALSKIVDPLLSAQSTITLRTLGIYPCGETVFVAWETTDTAADVRVSKMRGVDIFKVLNGKVVLKDAYRKSY
ncbi:nuclear transport factor 2 family protein [Brucella cytisi]|uniref:nuclear transport factor 2 family protein n=1 Tax=Brucella cytisi TaxID=407152 RepID=UPI0035E398D8